MKSLFPQIRSIVLQGCAVFAITFALLETSVRLLPFEKPPESFFKMDFHADLHKQNWYPQWQREHDHLRRDFQAYELYRLEPYVGDLISIRKDGVRGSAERVMGALRVAMYGGSTLWGSFARNENTIPAFVEHEIHRANSRNVQVENHGEIGFVFSQELHRAIRENYSFDPPDRARVAVFFNGVNDVLSALANFGHGAEFPQGLPWEHEKYRYLFRLGSTGEITVGDIFKKFKTVRLARAGLAKLGFVVPDPKMVFIVPSEADQLRIADLVATRYIQLIETAHASLSALGVRPVFVLQPILPFKRFRDAEETRLSEMNRFWMPYFEQTYEAIRRKSRALSNEVAFVDLSQLFREEKNTVYWDVIHYTEAANARIGSAIAKSLTPILEQLPAGTKMGMR